MAKLHIEAEPRSIDILTEESALIVIDMQHDFLRRGGFGEALGNNPDILASTIEPIKKLLDEFRRRSMLVIFTREGHMSDLSDCPANKRNRWPVGSRIGDMGPMGRILIRGEPGHQIIEEVAPLPGEIIIDKPGKSAFYKTELEKILKKHHIENPFAVGVTSAICGPATISDGNDRGFNMIVPADAMASYDPVQHRVMLEIIKDQGGILGYVTDTQKVLDAFGNL